MPVVPDASVAPGDVVGPSWLLAAVGAGAVCVGEAVDVRATSEVFGGDGAGAGLRLVKHVAHSAA